MSNNVDLTMLLQDSNCDMSKVLHAIKRRQVHPYNKNRKAHSEYYHLFPLLKQYEDKFEQYCRMNINTFEYILLKINKHLVKSWCNLHQQPIVPEEKLVLTVRFLATGLSYTDLSLTFVMGISTVSNVVTEVMDLLWNKLYPLHMPVPTKDHFLYIAEEFWERWNFPHCIGAIDGRHIILKRPANSGTKYFNYKKYFSIVLQAVVDANYKFITIDVGGFGSQSDGGTFQASDLNKALKEGLIEIPDEDDLPNSNIILPYYLIGDGAYPLMKNLMTPYRGNQLGDAKEAYNKRLSRARMVVECAFGIMCEKWRIFYTTIQTSPEIVELITKCACILHNVIIDLKIIANDDIYNLAQINEAVLLADNRQINNNFVVGQGQNIRSILTAYITQNPVN